MQGKNFAGNMKEFYYSNPAEAQEKGDENDGVTEEQMQQLRMIKRLIS